MFPNPIIFACGASYLEQRTGSDGVVRGYDEFSNTYEPMDAELEACNTAGPYQGFTLFALQRATTNVNAAQGTAPSRTVMRLCASALEDQQDDTGTQIAVNLLDERNLAYTVAVNIYQNLRRMLRLGWTIDYFRGPDFYVLMMALGYAGGAKSYFGTWQQNLGVYSGYWAQCVAQKDANLRKFESLVYI